MFGMDKKKIQLMPLDVSLKDDLKDNIRSTQFIK